MAVYLGSSGNAFVSLDGYALVDYNGVLLTATQSSNKFKIIIDNVVYRLNINLPIKESE